PCWMRAHPPPAPGSAALQVEGLGQPAVDPFIDLGLEGRGKEAQLPVERDRALLAKQLGAEHLALDVDALGSGVSLDLELPDRRLGHDAIDVLGDDIIELLGGLTWDGDSALIARHSGMIPPAFAAINPPRGKRAGIAPVPLRPRPAAPPGPSI